MVRNMLNSVLITSSSSWMQLRVDSRVFGHEGGVHPSAGG